MTQDGLHCTQLGAALNQVSRIGVAKFVRGQLADRQVGKKVIILPAEAAWCHVTTAHRGYNVDACLWGVLELCGEFVPKGDT